MSKILILISLLLLLIFLIPGCVYIGTGPPPTQPPPSQGTSFKTEPVIEAFMANPSVIGSDQTTTLSWIVTGANAVSIAPGIGQVGSTGTIQASPDISTSYTLTATNSAGTVNRTIIVTVQFAQPSPPPVQGTFAVIKAVAGTEPSPGYCPEILYADITTNGAGTVSYRWESAEGGGYSYAFSESFASAGTKRVTLIQEMRALPSGMYQVHIMSPNDIISNTTHYTTCAP